MAPSRSTRQSSRTSSTKRPKAEAEIFEIPYEEAAGLNRGQWIWEIGAWYGVRKATLTATCGTGWLNVEATPRAMKRIRRFCRRRGFKRAR
jgi:hypothetical protein